jgi:DNA (cytosine-5)-methyltransferase 1
VVKFFEAFSGCGGLSQGLINGGFKSIGAIDCNKNAIETYNLNHGKIGIVGMLEEFEPNGLSPDLLVAGIPCQGFSTIGKHLKDDPRNKLWIQFVRLIKKMRPTSFLVENVPPFIVSEEYDNFWFKVKILGYNVKDEILDAVNFGVPQYRKRAVVVGSMNKIGDFPEKMKIFKTVRDAIGDLPIEPNGINDHNQRNHSAKSVERYSYIPPGGNRLHLPKRLQNPCWLRLEKNDASTVMGRLEWDKPSGTIRTTFTKPECGRYIHPEADRGLTIREGARLQGFKDSFRFCGNSDEKAVQIGNAVPPPITTALTVMLRETL